MSEGRVLHKLLTNGEHDELEDVVIVEGEFMEVDEAGNAISQLILGVTPEMLLVAERQTDVNCNEDETDVNSEHGDLELCSVYPLCLIELNASRTKYGIIMTNWATERYFELADTPLNGDLEDRWYQWLDRIDYLHTDPYGYIRHMFDRYQLPYPRYLRDIDKATDVSVTDVTLVNRGNIYKPTSAKRRKGSKYVVATDLDAINEMGEFKIRGKMKRKKRGKLCCCIHKEYDD